MKKVISYSLWGDKPIYWVGALKNIELASKYFNGWTCRFYIDKNCKKELIDTIKGDNVEVVLVNSAEHTDNSYFNHGIGFLVGDKKEFQSQYKFSIAFENGAYRPEHNGYTTEKLPQAMQANTIGIYWGNPTIQLEFNSDSFINYHDFKTENDIIDYIIFLDQNNNEYLNKLNNPWFKDNQIPESNKIENITSFLYKIFEK